MKCGRSRQFVMKALPILVVRGCVFFTNDLDIPFAVFFDFLSGRNSEYILGRSPMNSYAATLFSSSLNFPTTLALRFEREEVIARIVRYVVQVDVQSHVGVNFLGLNIVRQTVRVGEK